MTPQEKAREILDIYIQSHKGLQENFQLFNIPKGATEEDVIKTLARGAAIATVHAIIYELHHIRKIENTIFYLNTNYPDCQDGEDRLKYWDEVTNELRQI